MPPATQISRPQDSRLSSTRWHWDLHPGILLRGKGHWWGRRDLLWFVGRRCRVRESFDNCSLWAQIFRGIHRVISILNLMDKRVHQYLDTKWLQSKSYKGWTIYGELIQQNTAIKCQKSRSFKKANSCLHCLYCIIHGIDDESSKYNPWHIWHIIFSDLTHWCISCRKHMTLTDMTVLVQED